MRGSAPMLGFFDNYGYHDCRIGELSEASWMYQ